MSDWVNGGSFVQHGDFVNNTKHVHSFEHLSCRRGETVQKCGHDEGVLLA